MMKREIKFRGKRVDNGEWVYGYYVFTYNRCYIINNLYIVLSDEDPVKEFIEVISETVNQYTGIKDKNGTKVYPGDVLSYKWKVEVFQNEYGTYMVKFHANSETNKPTTLVDYLLKREKAGTSICKGYRDCIVIGNIHQNPELIK